MLMSSVPCKYNTSECMGATMATAHLSSTVLHGYGDYTSRPGLRNIIASRLSTVTVSHAGLV